MGKRVIKQNASDAQASAPPLLQAAPKAMAAAARTPTAQTLRARPLRPSAAPEALRRCEASRRREHHRRGQLRRLDVF